MITRFFALTTLLLSGLVAVAQQPAGDLALNHNRLLREKTADGVYRQIGNFKVVGIPYLFGEKSKGNLFSSDAKAYNIFLCYNTYNQEVEFYSTANPDKPLVKSPGEVDSFEILPNLEIGLTKTQRFVCGPMIGSSEKAYFLELFAGKRFGIYKRYKAELGYVSSNYIQSELRQFDLEFDYFYTDAEKKTVKKVKGNYSAFIKEFKSIKDISGVVNNDAFSANPDEALKKIFEYLNN